MERQPDCNQRPGSTCRSSFLRAVTPSRAPYPHLLNQGNLFLPGPIRRGRGGGSHLLGESPEDQGQSQDDDKCLPLSRAITHREGQQTRHVGTPAAYKPSKQARRTPTSFYPTQNGTQGFLGGWFWGLLLAGPGMGVVTPER